tara:strand:+ start:1068 stop:1469 length:402 start_codon:yes stop_codon:yes gene_type:complete
MPTLKEKKDTMYQNIFEHGENLKRVFKLHSSVDEIKLCKSLFRIENKAHAIAEDFCNGFECTEEEQDKIINDILNKVDKLLNFKSQKIPVFFNGDCRGYTLKIEDSYMKDNKIYPFYSDWGGFGIIAPSFKES